jgi:predicted RNase H-like HicB family nuclease
LKDYHINIFFSEEDGGYIADIPDLKFCSAFGTTPEEALAELEKAKKAWIEVALSTNRPIPPPRYRPAIYQGGPSRVHDRGGQD